MKKPLPMGVLHYEEFKYRIDPKFVIKCVTDSPKNEEVFGKEIE